MSLRRVLLRARPPPPRRRERRERRGAAGAAALLAPLLHWLAGAAARGLLALGLLAACFAGFGVAVHALIGLAERACADAQALNPMRVWMRPSRLLCLVLVAVTLPTLGHAPQHMHGGGLALAWGAMALLLGCVYLTACTPRPPAAARSRPAASGVRHA